MAVFVALLRSINVGGHNSIRMADLKRAFASMGLGRVQTYIQSGNVLFESEEEAKPLGRRIEHETGKVFGVSTTVVLRTAGELEQIIWNCPFAQEKVLEAQASSGKESLYVSMLLKPPTPQEIEKLSVFRTESDEYRVVGREVYLLCRQGMRNSRLASNLQRLSVPSTMRNWKTVRKLAALAKAMEA